MKKTAFLHALLILILLSVSWVLLYFKIKQPEEESPVRDQKVAVAPTTELQQSDYPTATKSQPDTTRPLTSEPIVPSAWAEWINYLQQQPTPGEMRRALDTMKDALFSMDREQGVARLTELINSRVNLETGLRFQVGKYGALTGAPDLQTLLLDWLGQMDPLIAAELAKTALLQQGYSLGEDAYVIHLKNYTLGTGDSVPTRDEFIRSYFDKLISNRQWTEQPTGSIAESMDFAVFLADGSLVPVLSGFMAEEQPPALGYAGSIAIERLMDLDPIGSVTAILETMDQPGMSSTARAGFIARLDPVDPQAFQLLTEYLQHPSTTQQEAATFLDYFPNLNKVFSYNLVSPEISITELGDHMDRLRSALDAVNDWQSDPVRNDIDRELEQTSQRLFSQIMGEPAP